MSYLSRSPIHDKNLKGNKNSRCVSGKQRLVGYLKIMSLFLSFKGYFVRNNWRQSLQFDPKEHARKQWFIIKINTQQLLPLFA